MEATAKGRVQDAGGERIVEIQIVRVPGVVAGHVGWLVGLVAVVGTWKDKRVLTGDLFRSAFIRKHCENSWVGV